MRHRNDPVEAVSSRVQAVVSYFAPTDWLNYGGEGKMVFDFPGWRRYHGVLDLYEFDAERTAFQKITDAGRVRRELQDLSPAQRVGRSAAPALLFHGENDTNVPLQQSERMVEALTRVGVPAELVVRPGAGHGWADNGEDTAKMIRWWNRHLLQRE
jgi:dipeptidyl aminopeptidase/acylaminoacyl peptidase